MKRKNGFTLIELLAIIVILAIIAVITVPIILGIIDDAKKKAAKASAYGYEDAINKYYLHRSLNDPNFEMQNKTYVVDANTGYLKYIDSSNSQNNITHEISISGKIPNTGSVEINNNAIKKACLQFGDYAVPIENDEVGDSVKGTCDGINIVEITSGQNIQGITAATTSTTTTTTTTTTTIGACQLSSTIPSCPGCVFAYTKNTLYYSGTPTTLTSNQYKENFEDVVSESGYNSFLGLKLNASGTIEKAYACGIENCTPYCIEGTTDGSKYSDNVDILNIMYPSCNASAFDSNADCNGSSVGGYASSNGSVNVFGGNGDCSVLRNGTLYCYEW